MSLQIDILYTKDCTDWQTADELLQQVLADLQLAADVNYFQIENDRQALEWYFAGSPTIRVNAEDLFPTDVPAGLRLRSYNTEDGILGHPTYAMLHAAMQAYAEQ